MNTVLKSMFLRGTKKTEGWESPNPVKQGTAVRFMLCLTVKGSGFFLLLLSKTSETQTFPRNLQGLEQKKEGAQGG